MSKELFQALLDKQFYTRNKNLLHRELFAGEIKDLFKVVEWFYDTPDSKSLSPTDLKILYENRYPVETYVKKNLINTFLDNLGSEPLIQEAAAEQALKQSLINRKSDEAATLLLEHQATKENKLHEIKEILKEIEALESGSEIESNIINMDIDYLLERTNQNSKWKFNIPELASVTGGIGDGTFTLIAGRVNSGKSLASISFCFSPGGFADQGAKILYLCNEEHGAFTGLRAVSSYTGFTRQEIFANIPGARERFKAIREQIIAVDDPRITMGGLEKLVEIHKPDIVVADMLDHLKINGEFAREDQRLGSLYRGAREIAKVQHIAFIGVSQTSAESDGKKHYGFDALAGSKTEKPAACDLILLLGMDKPNEETGITGDERYINVAKNKITGNHTPVTAIIKPQISRLVA